jgi:lysophospholipase L1-like esterase
MKGKWLLSGILILSLVCVLWIAAPARGAKPWGPAGQYSTPVARRDGTVTYLYRGSDEQIYLKKIDGSSIVSEQALSAFGRSFFFPALAEDHLGRLWILGEEWSAHQSRVVLARLTDGAPDFADAFRQDPRFNRAPDLAFDGAGSPWLAWAAGKSGDERLCAAEAAGGRTWTIASGNGLVVAHPRILADRQGRIWVFWAGAWRGERGVYFSIFDGRGWTEARKAGGRSNYPCLDAEPAADVLGRIWLVWSGYDGTSYGADYSIWDGRTWTATKRIDERSTGTARSPQLAFLNGWAPMAIWHETSERGRFSRASFYQSGAWTAPVDVGDGAEEGNFPKIAASGDRLITVGWHGGAAAASFVDAAAIRTSTFESPRSVARSAGQSYKHPSAFLYNPLLSEYRYIGFGDSLTYGVMDYKYAPEKGYIPRLQILLTRNFGTATLYNDGFAGELTGECMVRIDSVIANRQARYLLLLEGTNDVEFLDVPVDTAVFNLKEMLRKCLDAGVFPAIATFPPRRDWIWYYELYTDRFFALDAAIPLMASEKGVPLLDLFTIFDTYPGGGADSLLSTDGVHPNELGYQVMAEQWMKAIQAFPFPPIQIQIRKETDEILFYRRTGNMLSWSVNPKIADAAVIRGVRIYRRKRGEGIAGFRLLAFVAGASSYFDATIDTRSAYEYVLSAVRSDGIEGPASAIVL